MRRKVSVLIAFVAAMSAAAQADIATITGTMDANMKRLETRTFELTVTIGNEGFKGPLELHVGASSGLSLDVPVITPPVMTCDKVVGNIATSIRVCAGDVSLSAGQSFKVSQNILVLGSTYEPDQGWTVELVGDFLSGAPVRGGRITVEKLRMPRIKMLKAPSTIFQDSSVLGSTFALFRNDGDADGFVRSFAPTGPFTVDPPVDSATSLAPGAETRITITSNTRTPGNSEGTIFFGGDGLENIQVPVRIVVANPEGGNARPQPASSRKDVSIPASCAAAMFSVAETCTNPTYDVTFTNAGTGPVVGAFSGSKLFIVPPAGAIRIDPGETKSFTGSIDMTQFPRIGATSGSAAGELTLTYFAGSSGSQTIQPAAEGSSTSSITITIVTTVPPVSGSTAIPPLAQRCQTIGCWDEVALFVPGVGHVTGSVGQFISDVILYPKVGFGSGNVAARSLANVDFYFTPLGASSSSAVKASVAAVPPPSAATFGDIVSTVYSASQLGSLQVRAPAYEPDEIIGLNVNVFNVSNKAGTYGTTLPVFASYEAVKGGEKEYLTGLRKNATSHTNLYIQESQGSDITATLDFYNASGTKLGSASAAVPAFSAVQLGGNTVPEGTVSAVASVTGGSGALHAYATPVDDASGDTWAVVDWSRVFGYHPDQFRRADRNLLIPVAGAAHGANNTYFRTDVAIMNTGNVPATGTFKYFNRTGDVVSKPISLGVLETRVLEDVTTNFFGVTTDSVGFITYTAVSGNVVVTSRNYTSAPGSAATYGTAVPTLDTVTPNGSGFISGFGARKGRTERIGGIDDSVVGSTQPGSFRSSLGLVEVAGKPATVQVTIYYNTQTIKTTATEAASATYSLGPNGFLLIGSFTNNILGAKRAALGDLHNVTLEITVLDGDGQIVPFISSVDNGSGDSTFRVN